MRVVIEAAMRGERFIERILARMAKRRVADIMRQAQSLGEILVQPQRAGDHPADLRHFEAVGEAHAVVIAIGGDEHLRLVAQAAEGDRMDDAVAVALVDTAGAAGDRAFQREFPPARGGGIARQRG